MTTLKYTPGPWHTYAAPAVDVHIGPCVGSHTGDRLANVIYRGDTAQSNADALLIAAAPDMLNLLREWQCYVLHGSNRRYNEDSMLRMTEALIAKATVRAYTVRLDGATADAAYGTDTPKLRERDEAEAAVSRYEDTINERDRQLAEARAEVERVTGLLGLRALRYVEVVAERDALAKSTGEST